MPTADEFVRAATDGDHHFFIRHGVPSDLERKHGPKGRTLLYCASRETAGHYEVAQYLISRGANVNTRENSVQSTPLHGAAYYGNKAIVGLLLSAGADINLKNTYGSTAADEAAARGFSDIAELIRNGRSRRENRFHVPRSGALRFVDEDSKISSETGLIRSVSRQDVIVALRSLDITRDKVSGSSNRDRYVTELTSIGSGNEKAWHETLIKLYTSNTIHSQMNADLNAMNTESPYYHIACGLQSALAYRARTSGNYAGTTYKGAKEFEQADIDDYRAKIGRQIMWLQFASSTKSRSFAVNWSGPIKVIFQIEVGTGARNGVDISSISEFRGEQEVLFPARSKFTVLGVSSASDATVIRLCQVPR